jgi:hypothetical protein
VDDRVQLFALLWPQRPALNETLRSLLHLRHQLRLSGRVISSVSSASQPSGTDCGLPTRLATTGHTSIRLQARDALRASLLEQKRALLPGFYAARQGIDLMRVELSGRVISSVSSASQPSGTDCGLPTRLATTGHAVAAASGAE